jgi:predicted DNA-binding protein (MmcQ/YjbR family)
MNIELIREYCLSKTEVTECFPFDDVTLVFKVSGKMFVLAHLEGEHSINLKCNPELAIELRDKYDAVQPGYHMNKTHWNTILVNGTIPDKLLMEWIDHSYWLVVSQLPKMIKLKIEKNESKF